MVSQRRGEPCISKVSLKVGEKENACFSENLTFPIAMPMEVESANTMNTESHKWQQILFNVEGRYLTMQSFTERTLSDKYRSGTGVVRGPTSRAALRAGLPSSARGGA